MPVDLERDLARFEAMLDSFERYLTSRELYRKVTVDQADGRHEVVTMSIGVLLDLEESLRRVAERAPASESKAIRSELDRLEEVRSANRDAYGRKLGRELRGNLDAWRWYLDDCQAGASDCAHDYPSEVRKRLRVHGLLVEAERSGVPVDAARRNVAALDDDLRRVFVADLQDYCGPIGGADRYPEARFWWLYGRPRLSDD